MFHVGQLVVCVDDALATAGPHPLPGWQWDGDLDGLRAGVVYTIREPLVQLGQPCVRLVEIVRAESPFLGGEAAYLAKRFRPLDPLRLSIFTAMLEDAPEPVAPLVTA